MSLTTLALLAFAANSLLCRLALGSGEIDATSFSAIRLLSAAAVLCIPAVRSRRAGPMLGGNWASAIALALYAILFSFAYLNLTAGTGALILFAAVQATMMGAGLIAGERLRIPGWIGFAVALAGFVWLVAPGLQSPPLLAAGLMAIAGAAWGVYSLRGRAISDPIAETAGNFMRALPFGVIVWLVSFKSLHTSPHGISLAIVSGAAASGIGYVVWYAALRGLRATQAGVVQLLVPVLTAIGGVALLGEDTTLRFVLSSLMVLGGVLLALLERRKPTF